MVHAPSFYQQPPDRHHLLNATTELLTNNTIISQIKKPGFPLGIK